MMTAAVPARLASFVILLGMLATSPAAAAGDPEKGRLVFNQCKACHALEPGQHRIGPSLHGVVGRKAGSAQGFRYSKAMEQSEVVWNDETLNAYLESPRKYIPGNRMTFVGLRKPEDRANVIEFLKQAK